MWSDYISSQWLTLACNPVKLSAKDIRLSSITFFLVDFFGSHFTGFLILQNFSCKCCEIFRRFRNTREQFHFYNASSLQSCCSAHPFILLPLLCDYSSRNLQRVKLRWTAHLLKAKIQTVRQQNGLMFSSTGFGKSSY